MPSPLKSPIAIAVVLLLSNETEYVVCVLKVPFPLPSRMLTFLSVEFATARSSLPSPLKSPTTIAIAPLPVAYFVADAVNPPEPSPIRMLTFLSLLFRTARSITPSPSKSPAVKSCGLLPTPIGEPAAVTVCCPKVPVPRLPPPSGQLLLDVSRRDTLPLGDRLGLPTPMMVVVRDQLPAEPPV